METRHTACPQLLIFWNTCVFTIPSDSHQAQMHDILYSCSSCKEGIRLIASVYVLTDTTNLRGRISFSFRPWNTVNTSIPNRNIVAHQHTQAGHFVGTSIPYRDIVDTSIPNRDIVDTSIPNRDIVDTSIPNRDIVDTSIPNRDIVDTSIPNRDIVDTSILRLTTKWQLSRSCNCCSRFAIWKPLKGIRDFPRYFCVRCYLYFSLPNPVACSCRIHRTTDRMYRCRYSC